MPKIELELADNLLPYEGIAVIGSLNDENQEILTLITWGNPKASSSVGMLQFGLDRTRVNLSGKWTSGE
jgi:hypothetical protein